MTRTSEKTNSDAGIVADIVNATFRQTSPWIKSISPNPAPTGTPTLTITGSGFENGAIVLVGGNSFGTTYVNSTTLITSPLQPVAATLPVQVNNPGGLPGRAFDLPFVTVDAPPPVISPASATVDLSGTQQFTSAGATTWSALAGTVSSAGLYKAPASMTISGTDTVSATGPSGTATVKVNLIQPAFAILGVSNNGQLPLGLFTATVTGYGLLATSTAQLNGSPLDTSFSGGTLTVSGFASRSGSANLTVTNGAITSAPFLVQVGIPNALASAAAARRFLERAAFGPTPADAAHVQTIGQQAWIAEQFNMPQISSYSSVPAGSDTLSTHFLTDAVMNPDQLRQRVAFALSQIFVTSLQKLNSNANMVPYQNMLLADAFTNYRQIMSDVTLSSAMGQYLDTANNAAAVPGTPAVANENFARELMQLFTIGTEMLNQDGSVQFDANNLPVPAYSQFTVTEFARVFTGWTYPQGPGQGLVWNSEPTPYGPMVPYPSQHDSGSKQLLTASPVGAAAAAGLSPQADINNALDNIFNHPNLGPFVGRQLIQHLVKGNPSPAYVSRVAAAFNGVNGTPRGDMKAVIAQILTDPEATANDEGGADNPTDGHLQEPALFFAGVVRAFGGTLTDQNGFGWDLYNLGESVFSPPSVFNYFSPGYVAPGTGLTAPEFQIHTPDAAIGRLNVIANDFENWSTPVMTDGPGMTIDLSPFIPLASSPAELVDALDLTLTHGVMPQAMKSQIIDVVAGQGVALAQVEIACYMILTSNYYAVWH